MSKKGGASSPMDAALSYLSPKARTVREVEENLDSLDYAEYDVYSTVERLKELGYLDDEKYARDFIATRRATKPVSKRKLCEQLMAHKLGRDTVESALSELGDDDELSNAVGIAEKYARQFGSLEPDERRERVMKRLMGRGYDYDVCRAAADAALSGEE